jgi:hypothetical protein
MKKRSGENENFFCSIYFGWSGAIIGEKKERNGKI